MRRYEKKVKDKSIRLDGNFKYLASIEYFQDVPERDGDSLIEKQFETFKAAQKYLRKFPRDVWDGYAPSDLNYREIDERKRYARA